MGAEGRGEGGGVRSMLPWQQKSPKGRCEVRSKILAGDCTLKLALGEVGRLGGRDGGVLQA